jgi:hypothetical protein
MSYITDILALLFVKHRRVNAPASEPDLWAPCFAAQCNGSHRQRLKQFTRSAPGLKSESSDIHDLDRRDILMHLGAAVTTVPAPPARSQSFPAGAERIDVDDQAPVSATLQTDHRDELCTGAPALG